MFVIVEYMQEEKCNGDDNKIQSRNKKNHNNLINDAYLEPLITGVLIVPQWYRTQEDITTLSKALLFHENKI